MPLVFLPGFIGRIFTELSLTIAAAVILSSFVALTLSPMMASKLLKPTGQARGPARWVDLVVTRLRNSYADSADWDSKAHKLCMSVRKRKSLSPADSLPSLDRYYDKL